VFIADPSGTTRELVTRTPAQLLGDAGGVTGTGASGQVAFWNGTSSQTGNSGLTWNNTTKTLSLRDSTDTYGSNIATVSFNTEISSPGSLFVNVGSSVLRGLQIRRGGENVWNIGGSGNIVSTTAGAGTGASIYAGSTGAFGFWSVGSTLASNVIYLNNRVDNNNYGVRLAYRNAGTEATGLALQNNGNVLINTTTDAGFRLDVNGTARVQGTATITGSTTASSAIARGANLTSTLVAAANNDVLVGLDIFPTFTNGAFTGVNNLGLRVRSGRVVIGNSTVGHGNLYVVGGEVVLGGTTALIRPDNFNNGSGGGIQLSASNTVGDQYVAFGQTLSGTGVFTERWRIFSGGIMQSNGAQTIRTSTGNLTLATEAGNGNIILSPNGTGEIQLNKLTRVGYSGTNSIYLEQLGGTNFWGRFTLFNNSARMVFDTYYNGLNTGFNFRHNGIDVAIINGVSGNLLLNTTTDAGFRLDVNGTARVQGAATITGVTRIGNSSYNDGTLSGLVVGINGASASRVTIANNGNYQDVQFIATAISSGNINTWSFGQRRDTFFGNTIGSFQIVGSYTDNAGAGAPVGGGYRVPLICNPNGDVIIAGASANAVNGNVIIGSTTSIASAKLSIDSTTQGFLPPRMTAAQRTAIVSPAEGLLLIQTDGVQGLYIYINATWRAVTMV
jgi:hypothetical protein